MIPIFQRQDYREITQEWFTKGYYQEALAAYENIYQTERDNLSESDLGILHLGLKVVYTFRKPEFGQSYSVGNN